MAWKHWHKALNSRVGWPGHTDLQHLRQDGTRHHSRAPILIKTGDELEGIRKETFAICIKRLSGNLCHQINKQSALTEGQVSTSLSVAERHITWRSATMLQSTCNKPKDIERILTNPLRTLQTYLLFMYPDYTGCVRDNLPHFGRTLLPLNYTDITKITLL